MDLLNKKNQLKIKSVSSPKHPIKTLDKIESVLERSEEDEEIYNELKKHLSPPLPDSAKTKSRRSTVSPTLYKQAVENLEEIDDDDKNILPKENKNTTTTTNDRRSTIDPEKLEEMKELLNDNDLYNTNNTNSRRNTADPSMNIVGELDQSETTDLMKIIKAKENIIEEKEEKEDSNRRLTADYDEMKSTMGVLNNVTISPSTPSSNKKRGRPKKSSTPNENRLTADPDALNSLMVENIDDSIVSSETPSKKKRGRPKKSLTPKDKKRKVENNNIENEEIIEAATPSKETPRRGKGKPRKIFHLLSQ